MSAATADKIRWTTSDLELMPDNGVLYEIIDGDLLMSKQPHWHHQETINNIGAELRTWALVSGQGRVLPNPGVLFDEFDNVVPDMAWVSHERLAAIEDSAGHLTAAPELVIEVLSPGAEQERRDRETKLKLYSQRGAREYWIVDWRAKQVEVYRRKRAIGAGRHTARRG